jgi:predicted extracellular nuclease
LYAENPERFRIVFYNAENFFDCIDDSLKNDEDYLPGGMRGWGYSRYETKQMHIAKVLVSIGEWSPPPLVGMCEIESDKVLFDLTRYSVMKSLGYRFIHYESADLRGVDVALLYQPDRFKPLRSEPISIFFPGNAKSTTRDILYVCGKDSSTDSLHVFVCHFPSRLGGEAESEFKRIYTAEVLRTRVDSLLKLNLNARIVIMGDFNDYPDNSSMCKSLKAANPDDTETNADLFNLMFPLHLKGLGSHRHEGEWGCLDQIIVSKAFFESRGLRLAESYGHIFNADFLLEDDLKYLGKQPFRTYSGFQYTGGYSDHLPVYADFYE